MLEPSFQFNRREFIRAAILGLVTVLVSLIFVNTQIDDSYITFRVARNIAAGQGYSFNPGEQVYVNTSFLWPLLLAPAYRLGVDIIIWSSILGGLLAWGMTVFFYGSLRRLGVGFCGAICGTISLAFSALIARWHLAGMEMPLALFLFSLTLYLWLEQRRDTEKRPWFMLTATLGFLARPELALLALLLAVDYLVANHRSGRRVFELVALGLLPLLPWLGFALGAFGSLIPLPYSMKAVGFSAGQAWRVIAESFSNLAGSDFAVGVALLIVIVAALVRDKKRRLMKGNLGEVWPLAAFALGNFLFLVLHGVTRISTRYTLLISISLIALTFWGLSRLWPRMLRSLRENWRNLAVAAGSVVSFVFFTLAFIMPGVVFLSRIRVPMLHEVAREINEVFEDRGGERPRVAVGEIGVIGYETDCYVIDTFGLCTPERGDFDEKEGLVNQTQPEYLVAYTPRDHYEETPGFAELKAEKELLDRWTLAVEEITPDGPRLTTANYPAGSRPGKSVTIDSSRIPVRSLGTRHLELFRLRWSENNTLDSVPTF